VRLRLDSLDVLLAPEQLIVLVNIHFERVAQFRGRDPTLHFFPAVGNQMLDILLAVLALEFRLPAEVAVVLPAQGLGQAPVPGHIDLFLGAVVDQAAVQLAGTHPHLAAVQGPVPPMLDYLLAGEGLDLQVRAPLHAVYKLINTGSQAAASPAASAGSAGQLTSLRSVGRPCSARFARRGSFLLEVGMDLGLGLGADFMDIGSSSSNRKLIFSPFRLFDSFGLII
jgi:hypothetical protein